MYKILENNQIIDVMEELKFVKYLPKTKKTILVDWRQANGIVSSNGDEVYHILGTLDSFEGRKRTVRFEKIDELEYERLTTQVQKNRELEGRVRELEKLLKEIQNKILI